MEDLKRINGCAWVYRTFIQVIFRHFFLFSNLIQKIFLADTWNPAWSISTILTGLLSFMLETTPTLGSCESTLLEKRRFADNSLEFNLKNEIFVELFPETVEEIKLRLQKVKEARENNNNKVKENGTTAKNSDATALGEVENANNAAVQSGWHSLTTNVILFLLFLIFALIVNHILKTMNVE